MKGEKNNDSNVSEFGIHLHVSCCYVDDRGAHDNNALKEHIVVTRSSSNKHGTKKENCRYSTVREDFLCSTHCCIRHQSRCFFNSILVREGLVPRGVVVHLC